MPVSIDNIGDVRFARLVMPAFSATVRKASWMPKSASYDAFGTVSYSVPADLAQAIRAELKLADDVNVGVATRATFADVEAITAKLASHVGEAFAIRGNATLTVGVNADDSVRVKDGWVNLTLVLTNETGEWVDRPSSLATTSRVASAM